MATQDDFRDEPPAKTGMSSTTKVLLILGSIAGLCMLLCCGGIAYVAFTARNAIQQFAANFTTNDPDEIRARTERIVHIEIPDSFPPMQAFDWFFMKQIIYGKPGSQSMIMIIEINEAAQGRQGTDLKEQRRQILRSMRQQQQGQPGGQPGNVNAEMDEESSETREFTVDGQKVPFEFIKGNSGGTPTRQVVGILPGRQGMVMVMAMIPESDYDEELIVKMIQSIRLPAEEADDESEVPEGKTGEPRAAPEAAPAGDQSAEPGAKKAEENKADPDGGKEAAAEAAQATP